ncbi:MAG: hypothetical protein NVV70_16865 [Cellulomonas sp.]|nr:hypothetical protein [Cellulomonas sp.]MCR6649718.1 hypothetical protein [Cellulomonas sp.]
MTSPILRWFTWDHLPPHLRPCVQRFSELAQDVDANLPDSAEKSVALRKLLEAKDAAVRAAVENHEKESTIR